MLRLLAGRRNVANVKATKANVTPYHSLTSKGRNLPTIPECAAQPWAVAFLQGHASQSSQRMATDVTA